MTMHLRTTCLILLCIAPTFTSAPALAQYTLTTLAEFDSSTGNSPTASLVRDTKGNLYGTTYFGGVTGRGTVFRVAAGSNALTTLASFSATNGSNPYGGLILDAAGNLLGTTQFGGPSDNGAVFKVAAETNVLSTIATFNGTNGRKPSGNLVADASGNLYGTTQEGGASGYGSVFRVAAGTNALTTLASLDSAHGSNPWGGIRRDASGNMYGAAYSGGANGLGTVFKVAAGSNALSTLASFSGTANGSNPYAGSLVADSSGNMYGTTYFGGASGYGTVYRVAAGTNVLTRLASFTDANGSNPIAGVTVDAAGNIFGATQYGGPGGLDKGTIFRIAAGSNTITTIAEFTGPNGAEPYASLIADANGNLYGTTAMGGANGLGTVFRLSPAPADFDSNGVVNSLDLTLWGAGFGAQAGALHSQGDTNADGDVDGADFLIWQQGSGSAQVGAVSYGVPEPSSRWLIVVAASGLFARSQGTRRSSSTEFSTN